MSDAAAITKRTDRRKHLGTYVNGPGLRTIPHGDLRQNPDNLRTYDAYQDHREALKASIRANGVLEPFKVYADGTVQAGNTRWLVIGELLSEGVTHADNGKPLADIPALIVEREEDRKTALIRQIEGNRGAEFDPLDQAKVFAALREEGMTNAEIERNTGYKAMWVGMMLTLYDEGTEEIHKAIREGRLSATLAAETLRAHKDPTILTDALALAYVQGKNKATQKHVDATLRNREDDARAQAEQDEIEARAEEAEAEAAAPAGEAEAEADADDTLPWEGSDADATVEDVAEADTDVSDIQITDEPPTAEVDEEEVLDAEPDTDAAPAPAPQPEGKTATTMSALKAELMVALPALKALAEVSRNGTQTEMLETLADNAEAVEDLIAKLADFGIKID